MEAASRPASQRAVPETSKGRTHVGTMRIAVTRQYAYAYRSAYSNVSNLLLDMAEVAQRFFHPSEYEEMLSVILPRFVGDDVDVSTAHLHTRSFDLYLVASTSPSLPPKLLSCTSCHTRTLNFGCQPVSNTVGRSHSCCV